MLLSVVAVILPVEVPPERENTTVKPPAVKLLPLASLAVKVKLIEFPDKTVGLDTVTKDCDNENAPGLTVIVGKVEVMANPPTVALIVVAVPETTPVKVAV